MMRVRLGSLAFAVAIASACSFQSAGVGPEKPYQAPRTPDNTPDLSGIWQANNTANWDLEPHEARMGPVVALAAAFSIPPGARRARAPTLRVPDQRSGAWDAWDRGDAWDVARPAQPVRLEPRHRRRSGGDRPPGQSWSGSRPRDGKTAVRVARMDLSTSSPGS